MDLLVGQNEDAKYENGASEVRKMLSYNILYRGSSYNFTFGMLVATWDGVHPLELADDRSQA